MTPGEGPHQRRSIRLKDSDYSQAGAYFVTICAQKRESLFGQVVNGEMVLNHAGQMVRDVWENIPLHYKGTDTGAFVVMPNHVHGIVILVGAGPRACPGPCACPGNGDITHGQPQGVAPTMSLADVVHRFKTMTTKRYADGVKNDAWRPFPGRLWQRNYYEHIIRDEIESRRISEYIAGNPAQWEIDRENPGVRAFGPC